MKHFILAATLITSFSVLPAQDQKEKKTETILPAYERQTGTFSLGLRTTMSSFSDGDPKGLGYGVGGQARVMATERVNTEWFADVLLNNLHNKAHRTDLHIGWSVMFYVIHPRGFTRKFTPYVLAGHCFDETFVRINGENGNKASRFSSAVQAGFGCHYNITPKFDISLAAQYMLHLGKELDAEEDENGEMQIVTRKNAGWEGHLLISLTINYKIAKLWKEKD